MRRRIRAFFRRAMVALGVLLAVLVGLAELTLAAVVLG